MEQTERVYCGKSEDIVLPFYNVDFLSSDFNNYLRNVKKSSQLKA